MSSVNVNIKKCLQAVSIALIGMVLVRDETDVIYTFCSLSLIKNKNKKNILDMSQNQMILLSLCNLHLLP